MAVFQSIIVAAKDFGSLLAEARKQLIPDHSLGLKVEQAGINLLGQAIDLQQAMKMIDEAADRWTPAYAVQLQNSHQWVVGGRFKD